MELHDGEKLVKEVNIKGWDAYITSQRLIVEHDYGFGNKRSIMDNNLTDIAYFKVKREFPWYLYTIGILFSVLFLTPMIIKGREFLEGPVYWMYLSTPVIFMIGIAVVGYIFFMPKIISIKLSNGKRLAVPCELLPVFDGDRVMKV
ncbi:MAG: hypothetical protein HY097_06595 [Nitrospinae bacterium]|nr:hypothetical protein [Nitrospinota bacterium]